MNIPEDLQRVATPTDSNLSIPRYRIGDTLHYTDGRVLGEIVIMQGNPPCRFYGIRQPDLVGIVMIRQNILEDPEHYKIRVK